VNQLLNGVALAWVVRPCHGWYDRTTDGRAVPLKW